MNNHSLFIDWKLRVACAVIRYRAAASQCERQSTPSRRRERSGVVLLQHESTRTDFNVSKPTG